MARKKLSKKVMCAQAESLRRVRKKFDLNQRDAAKMLNTSLGSISLWENCERKMPGPVLKLLGLYESGKLKKDD